jgi:hypothetical protein
LEKQIRIEVALDLFDKVLGEARILIENIKFAQRNHADKDGKQRFDDPNG